MRSVLIGLLVWLPAASLVPKLSGQVAPAAERQRDNRALIAASSGVSAASPGWLAKLGLSPDQQQRIEKIVADHDAQFDAAWKQFGNFYQDTLRTEAIVLATIEEHFTESQRREVHNHRRKFLSDSIGQQASPAAQSKTSPSANPADDGKAALGVALTPEQEAFGKKIQDRFQQRLRVLSEDVQLRHNRLLSIEMDKLAEIEKVLTAQQREQLSQLRQTAASMFEEGLPPRQP